MNTFREQLKRQTAASSSKKASSRERYVLIIGDEGLIFIHLKDGAVLDRQFSPAPDAPETQTLRALADNNPSIPIVPLFDTLDQTYAMQTLPPVSALSVRKLMMRRLDREFAANYLKGAQLLGRQKEGRKDWQFLMAAMERSGNVAAWLDELMDWPNPCPAIYLLPLETTTITSALHNAFEPADMRSDVWRLLVSYNKVSGLRQVVSRNDNFILTRLSQPTMDSTAETIAGTIEQEVVSTNEYLKRLMPDEQQELDVFIIAPSEVARSLDPKRLLARSVHLMTPHEAANLLGLQNGTQPNDRFGDVTLGSSIGQKTKYRLPLLTPELKRFTTYYKAIKGQKIAAILIALLMIGWGAKSLWTAGDFIHQAADLEDKRSKQQSLLAELNKQSETKPEVLDKIIDVMGLYQTLLNASYNPEPLLTQIGTLLPENVRTRDLIWKMPDAAPVVKATARTKVSPKSPKGKSADAVPEEEKVELTMTLEFPVNLADDRKQLQALTNDTLNALRAGLPDYTINYNSTPDILDASRPVDVALAQGTSTKPVNTQAPTAALKIVGPWKPKAASPSTSDDSHGTP